jgi:hypothetical protein
MNGRGTNDDRAMRCSTTELRSVRLRQESNLRHPLNRRSICGLRHRPNLMLGDGMHHRGISEESFRARFLRYLVLRDYAPIPQSGHSGRVFRPCFLRRGSNSLLSPPVKQTSGQGTNARGVRGLEPRSFQSCQMYPRTPPLTTTFLRRMCLCRIPAAQ